MELTAVGVPEIVPSEVSNDRPAGRVGEIDHDVTAPPLAEGVTDVMAVPLVSVNVAGLYVREDGMTSFTVMVTVAVSLPPVFEAVIVYVVDVLSSVGVPEMLPSVVLNVKPAGSVAEMDHVVTAPPLEVGVTDVMAVPLVNVNEFGL